MAIINSGNAYDINPNDPLILGYADQVDTAIRVGDYSGPLTTICPECGADFRDPDEAHNDDQHIIVSTTSDTTAVIVGCEGYYVVNPNLVGLDVPNWMPFLIDPDGHDGYQR